MAGELNEDNLTRTALSGVSDQVFLGPTVAGFEHRCSSLRLRRPELVDLVFVDGFAVKTREQIRCDPRSLWGSASTSSRRSHRVRSVAALRWVTFHMTTFHMIEEYPRQCGHPDLLRQVIDGATGN